VKVYVNDEGVELAERASVAALLEAMALAGLSGVAVAVNDEVVPRGEWGSRPLEDGDRVLLIAPIQGG
jgi:sulfur carrier protein